MHQFRSTSGVKKASRGVEGVELKEEDDEGVRGAEKANAELLRAVPKTCRFVRKALVLTMLCPVRIDKQSNRTP